MNTLKDRIKQLKEEKNAVILAHYYQEIEVQEIADFVEDSFGLARKATETDKDIIVFCGVHFMAESAKILNPDKKVLLPALDAGCPMADMIGAEDVVSLKEQHPGAAAVCYVNSSAAVKGECDVCCTSSNAVKVVGSLPNDKIIFVPDENLGDFIARQLPDKEFILFPGFCPTHRKINTSEVTEIKRLHPDAPVLVHPECTPEVVALSDFAGSTAQIINYALNSDKKEFIIGTEKGVIDYLKAKDANKQYYLLSHRLICPNMKKTRPEDVLNVLENESNEIILEQEEMEKAYRSLARMMNVK